MINHDTLGLENLALDKTAAPPNASRTRKRKGRRAKDQAFLPSELQQAAGQPISSFSSSTPSMLLSHQPLPIATLGASTSTLNRWPLRGHNSRFTPAPPNTPKCLPVQASVSTSDSPSVSKYYQSCSPVGRKATAVPLVQPKLSSGYSGFSVQKSALSVMFHRHLLPPVLTSNTEPTSESLPLNQRDHPIPGKLEILLLLLPRPLPANSRLP